MRLNSPYLRIPCANSKALGDHCSLMTWNLLRRNLWSWSIRTIVFIGRKWTLCSSKWNCSPVKGAWSSPASRRATVSRARSWASACAISTSMFRRIARPRTTRSRCCRHSRCSQALVTNTMLPWRDPIWLTFASSKSIRRLRSKCSRIAYLRFGRWRWLREN